MRLWTSKQGGTRRRSTPVKIRHQTLRKSRRHLFVPFPQKSSRPLESLQKTRYATSRNPRNGAAILAVPRLNLLRSCRRDFKAAGVFQSKWIADVLFEM